ncbi:Cytochrome c oxidase assembly protein cox18, mitochondrial [Chytriomyces hyalinus]|nr:Cytochrome c oxidase assembly protein cox18, mitochondrial [Chytriomyces hyalinus]
MVVSISERAYALMPVDGFNEGGILWFLDLSVADPTILLPLIVGGLHLANIEMHSSTVANPTVRQRAFKLLFQSVSILMIPLATQVPAGVALYWASSAGFSFMQNFALQSLLKPRPLNK